MTRDTRWTVRLRFLAMVLGGVVIGLLICEVAIRLLRPGENLYASATLGVFAPDPELGWVHKHDYTGSRKWLGRIVLIRTDAEGHRIPNMGVSNGGAELIAFAGDSYVFGYEVNAEETFVHLLGEASRKRTVNLGVGGYALSQECLALRRFMAQKTEITQGFLVIYLGNDIESGAYPSKTLGNTDIFALLLEDGPMFGASPCAIAS
jgi:hypothetical protein